MARGYVAKQIDLCSAELPDHSQRSNDEVQQCSGPTDLTTPTPMLTQPFKHFSMMDGLPQTAGVLSLYLYDFKQKPSEEK